MGRKPQFWERLEARLVWIFNTNQTKALRTSAEKNVFVGSMVSTFTSFLYFWISDSHAGQGYGSLGFPAYREQTTGVLWVPLWGFHPWVGLHYLQLIHLLLWAGDALSSKLLGGDPALTFPWQPFQLIFSFPLAKGNLSSHWCFLISVHSFSLHGKRESWLFYTYIKWEQNEEVTVGLLRVEERVGRR